MSKTAIIPQIRITPEQRDELECLAEQDGRTLSDYVRRVIEQHLQSVQCLRELIDSPMLYVEPPKETKNEQ